MILKYQCWPREDKKDWDGSVVAHAFTHTSSHTHAYTHIYIYTLTQTHTSLWLKEEVRCTISVWICNWWIMLCMYDVKKCKWVSECTSLWKDACYLNKRLTIMCLTKKKKKKKASNVMLSSVLAFIHFLDLISNKVISLCHWQDWSAVLTFWICHPHSHPNPPLSRTCGVRSLL